MDRCFADGSLWRWRVGCESRSAAGLVGFTVEFTGESSLYQALSLNYYCDFVLERFGFARAGLNLWETIDSCLILSLSSKIIQAE